jgi:hypothetical protein
VLEILDKALQARDLGKPAAPLLNDIFGSFSKMSFVYGKKDDETVRGARLRFSKINVLSPKISLKRRYIPRITHNSPLRFNLKPLLYHVKPRPVQN